MMNKKLAAALVLLAMVPSLAYAWLPSEKSSWEDIQRSGYWAKFPKVWFGSVNVSVISVCVDGNMLRVKGGNAFMATPRAYNYKVCDNSSCSQWHMGTEVIPLSYEIEVTKSVSHEVDPVDFVKHYDIPVCQ